MFSTSIFCKVIKIPSKIFNTDPIGTIQSYIGAYNEISCYDVSNGINNELMLTVIVYYKALDSSKVYYIKPKELKEYNVPSNKNVLYISEMVSISIPKNLANQDIIPIEIKPMDKPITTPDKTIITNYYARPLKTPYKYFTSITPMRFDFKQQLLFIEKISSLNTIDMNQNTNPKELGITDVFKLVPEITKHCVQHSAETLVELSSSFLRRTATNSTIIKQITAFSYVKEIPDKLPSATNIGFVTHYNQKLINFIKNYKIGFLVASQLRTLPDLVIYIPSMAYTLSNQQLEAFSKRMTNDIITAYNFMKIGVLDEK